MAETKPEARHEPDAEGNIHIEVLMGPYRGQFLKVPVAVADAAVADKWAREPTGPPVDPDAPPPPTFTDEELATALAAADAAAAFLRGDPDAAPYPPEPPPPEGGETRRRSMKPDDEAGGYKTR